MKKVFLVSGIIAAMGLVAFSVSCGKDEETKKTTCSCTGSGSGQSQTATLNLADYGVTTCSALADYLGRTSSEYNYTCN